MFTQKTSAFSPCGEYFACTDDVGILTIWEMSSNNVKQQCNINSHLKNTCSSLIWGSLDNSIFGNSKDRKECQILVLGTREGSVFLYDFSSGKIFNHFVAGHTDVVKDMCLDSETKKLYSCSSDKSVCIWDIISGKIKQKWEADDEELYSICVIDDNNLLTGSTSILWWNIKEQNVIKKFNCQNTPVSILSVVKSTDVPSCSYFLSVSAGEAKITAWSLSETNSKKVVASFLLPEEPQNIDVYKCFSNDPMLLTAVTQSGKLVLFQHVLNGKTKSLLPNMTLHVMSKANSANSKPSSIPIISSKILACADSCVIAYGSPTNPVFEPVNLIDCPKNLTLARDYPIQQQKKHSGIVSEIKLCNKLNEFVVANGQASPRDSPYSSPRKKKLRETDIENSYISEKETDEPINKRLSADSTVSSKLSPNYKKKQKLSRRKIEKTISPESDSDEYITPTDPSELVDILVRGLKEESTTLINSVLQCDNSELIRSSVRNLPLHSLNLLLLELHRRLILQEKRYSSSLRKWLKEILLVHLPYLITCKDLTDILNKLRNLVNTKKAGETLLKMNMLRGLLKVQTQTLSSEDSDSEEFMET